MLETDGDGTDILLHAASMSVLRRRLLSLPLGPRSSAVRPPALAGSERREAPASGAKRQRRAARRGAPGRSREAAPLRRPLAEAAAEAAAEGAAAEARAEAAPLRRPPGRRPNSPLS